MEYTEQEIVDEMKDRMAVLCPTLADLIDLTNMLEKFNIPHINPWKRSELLWKDLRTDEVVVYLVYCTDTATGLSKWVYEVTTPIYAAVFSEHYIVHYYELIKDYDVALFSKDIYFQTRWNERKQQCYRNAQPKIQKVKVKVRRKKK